MTTKAKIAAALIMVAGSYLAVIVAPLFLLGGAMTPKEWKQMIYIPSSFGMGILGTLAVVGGILVMSKKMWWPGITGSICIFLASSIFAIFDWMFIEVGHILNLVVELPPALIALPALILFILSRKDFGHSVKTASS